MTDDEWVKGTGQISILQFRRRFRLYFMADYCTVPPVEPSSHPDPIETSSGHLQHLMMREEEVNPADVMHTAPATGVPPEVAPKRRTKFYQKINTRLMRLPSIVSIH